MCKVRYRLRLIITYSVMWKINWIKNILHWNGRFQIWKCSIKRHETFFKNGSVAHLVGWSVYEVVIQLCAVHMQRSRQIRIQLGRRDVRPVHVWVTAVTGAALLPGEHFILPASLLCLVVSALEASNRILQMRLDVGAGGAGVQETRVGEERRTVSSKGAVLWLGWRSGRARIWGWSPRERAHVPPVVGELMKPGYVGSISPQVGEIQRLRGRKI